MTRERRVTYASGSGQTGGAQGNSRIDVEDGRPQTASGPGDQVGLRLEIQAAVEWAILFQRPLCEWWRLADEVDVLGNGDGSPTLKLSIAEYLDQHDGEAICFRLEENRSWSERDER